MKIIYLITKILTYPGAFMKGFWEHITCRMLKLQVTDRRYLRPNEACGHAAHTPAMTPAKAFWLSFLPYIAQRILGWIFLGASVAPLLIFKMHSLEANLLLIPEIVALFLGISFISNSFPQWEDAKRHWRLFYGKHTPEEEQAMAEYNEALLAAFDAVPAPEGEEQILPEEQAEALEQIEAEEQTEAETAEQAEAEDQADPDEQAEADEQLEALPPALPEMPDIPRFAGLAGKIILAPCNAYFLAGAWLEKNGIPAILAIAATVALLILG